MHLAQLDDTQHIRKHIPFHCRSTDFPPISHGQGRPVRVLVLIVPFRSKTLFFPKGTRACPGVAQRCRECCARSCSAGTWSESIVGAGRNVISASHMTNSRAHESAAFRHLTGKSAGQRLWTVPKITHRIGYKRAGGRQTRDGRSMRPSARIAGNPCRRSSRRRSCRWACQASVLRKVRCEFPTTKSWRSFPEKTGPDILRRTALKAVAGLPPANRPSRSESTPYRQVLRAEGIGLSGIGALICSTTTPPSLVPSTACLILHRLAAEERLSAYRIRAFDVSRRLLRLSFCPRGRL